MKILIVFLVMLLIGCTSQQNNIEKSEVIETVEGFFRALNVENNNPNLIDKYVTDDFIIYEAGKKMNKQDFLEFISGIPITKSQWDLSDFRISTDKNSAHVSQFNTGTFEKEMDSLKLRQKFEWLESAYLVKIEDQVKIKFFFSDNITITTDTIN